MMPSRSPRARHCWASLGCPCCVDPGSNAGNEVAQGRETIAPLVL